MSVNKVGSNGSLTPIATRGQFTQYSTMPTASADIVNKIVQYIGTTNQNYTNGYFYKCTLSGSNYIWTNINVQAGGSGSDNIVNGYFNPTDNLFYEESTYTTAITGASNVLYISLDTDFSYRYNGSIFVRVDKEIDDTTTASNKTWSSNKISSEIVPNGSTVTPINDIATWLKCAGLHQSYTILNEVLADSAVLSALMASTNAVDYLVRSTTWATTICANETAMNAIDSSDYCIDILLGNSTWCTALSGSTYWNEITMNPLVPAMTNDTTPKGQVLYSSQLTTGSNTIRAAYTVFNLGITGINHPVGIDAVWQCAANDNAPYIGYKFDTPTRVNEIRMTSHESNLDRNIKTAKFQGSNDGSTWTDIQTISTGITAVNQTVYIVINNSNSYLYYRLYITELVSANLNQAMLSKLQFLGRGKSAILVDTKADISAIAPEELGSTSSRAYAVGEHFYKNGKFCTAKAAIAQGAQFTLGTNYVEGTVADATDLKYFEHIDNTTNNFSTVLKIYRQGKIGFYFLHIYCYPANTIANGTVINMGTVPEGFRADDAFFYSAFSPDGQKSAQVVYYGGDDETVKITLKNDLTLYGQMIARIPVCFKN